MEEGETCKHPMTNINNVCRDCGVDVKTLSVALTPGQERIIFKLSRMVPESFLITQISPEVRVGTTMSIMGKKGTIKLLFFDHRTARPEDVSPVIAWDDGSVTVGGALLNFIE